MRISDQAYSKLHTGTFEQETLLEMIVEVEAFFKQTRAPRKWRKRVIMCLTEAFQNVAKYNLNSSSARLELHVENGSCNILVSNTIHKEEKATMQKALEKIVSLSRAELEAEYRKILSEVIQPGKSGLGWYCLCMYSTKPLQFRFEDSTINECIFHLDVEICTEDKMKNMKALHIEATEELPEVHLNKMDNRFEIKGRSIPNDAFEFYQPIKQWVNKYVTIPNEITELHCELEYFNSASQKNLLDIFKSLHSVTKKNKTFKLIWYYQEGDEELKQIGIIFQQLLHLDMKFIEVED